MKNDSKTNKLFLIIIVLLLGIIYFLVTNKSNLPVDQKEVQKEVQKEEKQVIKKESPTAKEIKQKPTVVTKNATNFYTDPTCQPNENCIAMPPLTHVTLNGYYDSHNELATTWFEFWQTNNINSKMNTQHVKQSKYSGDVNEKINFVISTSYQFRFVSQNSEGVTYGNVLPIMNFSEGCGFDGKQC